MLMARIQPADANAESVSSYDAKAISEVNASFKVHEQVNYVKCKTIIQTSDDDQIDSNIIFDDPYVENNGSTSEHDSNDHDEYHEIQMLAYNVQKLALAFGTQLTNVSLFFLLLLMILKNHATKETHSSQRYIVLILCFVLAILK
ncbi:hypothetical protein Tco_1015783 [Tanacetum coccineum]|uniref:Uncharacterized protein n=1 Tax=Tanacetum coccineum TaxID=301880 RepID=A0ABQ5FLS6_9ASTR